MEEDSALGRTSSGAERQTLRLEVYASTAAMVSQGHHGGSILS